MEPSHDAAPGGPGEPDPASAAPGFRPLWHRVGDRWEREPPHDLLYGGVVAGFVLARLGRIPKAGDTLTWRDLKIEIMDMDGMRIDKIMLRKQVGA